MDDKKIAEEILISLGGKDNIEAAAHCATRLRIVLKDNAKLNKTELEKTDGVKGYFETGGQHQIILGSGLVQKVYKEFVKIAEIESSNTAAVNSAGTKKLNILQRFVKMLSDIFVPIIPAIVAGGLLMGINNILVAKGLFAVGKSVIDLYPQTADLANMIDTFANAPFVFLPVLIAFSATKRFGGNPYLGAALGMLMVHPALLNGWSYGDAVINGQIPYWNIYGFKIAKVGYQGTVLPVLASSYILAYIENKLRKIVPTFLDNLLTPMFSLFITGLLTFVCLGPLMRTCGNLLTDGILMLYNTGGIVGGGIFGFFYAPIVITGMHHSFIAIETQLLADMARTGGSFIFPIAAMSNIAQGAACLSAFFLIKDEKLKGLAVPSGFSALLGITEPAMFGVNLKLRYPFLGAVIGSCAASIFITYKHVLAQALGAAGLPGIISIRPQNIVSYIIGMLISFVISAAVTFVLGKRENIKKQRKAG